MKILLSKGNTKGLRLVKENAGKKRYTVKRFNELTRLFFFSNTKYV